MEYYKGVVDKPSDFLNFMNSVRRKTCKVRENSSMMTSIKRIIDRNFFVSLLQSLRVNLPLKTLNANDSSHVSSTNEKFGQFCNEIYPLLSNAILDLQTKIPEVHSSFGVLNNANVYFHREDRYTNATSPIIEALINLHNTLDSSIKQLHVLAEFNGTTLDVPKMKRRRKFKTKRVIKKRTLVSKLSVLMEESEKMLTLNESFDLVHRQNNNVQEINFGKRISHSKTSLKFEKLTCSNDISKINQETENSLNVRAVTYNSEQVNKKTKIKCNEHIYSKPVSKGIVTPPKFQDSSASSISSPKRLIYLPISASNNNIKKNKKYATILTKGRSDPLLSLEHTSYQKDYCKLHKPEKPKNIFTFSKNIDGNSNSFTRNSFHSEEGCDLLIAKNQKFKKYIQLSDTLSKNVVSKNNFKKHIQKYGDNKFLISRSTINELIKCRSPADCCKKHRRKRSKFNLPYSVSATSLPLDDSDMLIINGYIQNKKNREDAVINSKDKLNEFIRGDILQSHLNVQIFETRFFDYERNAPRSSQNPERNEDRPVRRKSQYYDYPDEVKNFPRLSLGRSSTLIDFPTREPRQSVPLAVRPWAPFVTSDISLPRDDDDRSKIQQVKKDIKVLPFKIAEQTSTSDINKGNIETKRKKSLQKTSTDRKVKENYDDSINAFSKPERYIKNTDVAQNSLANRAGMNIPGSVFNDNIPVAYVSQIPQIINFPRPELYENEDVDTGVYPLILKEVNTNYKDSKTEKLYIAYPLRSKIPDKIKKTVAATNTEELYRREIPLKTDKSCYCNMWATNQYCKKFCTACTLHLASQNVYGCSCTHRNSAHNCGTKKTKNIENVALAEEYKLTNSLKRLSKSEDNLCLSETEKDQNQYENKSFFIKRRNSSMSLIGTNCNQTLKNTKELDNIREQIKNEQNLFINNTDDFDGFRLNRTSNSVDINLAYKYTPILIDEDTSFDDTTSVSVNDEFENKFLKKSLNTVDNDILPYNWNALANCSRFVTLQNNFKTISTFMLNSIRYGPVSEISSAEQRLNASVSKTSYLYNENLKFITYTSQGCQNIDLEDFNKRLTPSNSITRKYISLSTLAFSNNEFNGISSNINCDLMLKNNYKMRKSQICTIGNQENNKIKSNTE